MPPPVKKKNMKVLMVCLGNICRSPMAEGILRNKVQGLGMEVMTDSAGTSDYHVGEPPDRRATATMAGHGIDISDLRARRFTSADFQRFDQLFGMDADNLRDMLRMAPDPAAARKARSILDLVPAYPLRSVPDPYYGGEEGFEEVYRMLDQACDAFITTIRGPH